MTPVMAIELEQGRAVYNARCYYCHGYSGDARTVAASYLHPPPRDFTVTAPTDLTREHMIEVVRAGRPGTAMQGFSSVLSDTEIDAVVDFVRDGFMAKTAEDFRYHSVSNGWTGDPFASPAAPFASGELLLDTPIDTLTARQARGRTLFLSACVSCHARGQKRGPRRAWRIESVTYPEGNYVEHDEHALRPATAVFERHQALPKVELDPRERAGAQIYAASCVACHAGDGSGGNWIGGFLDPSPPNFANVESGAVPTRTRLAELIRDGIAGSAMPAWRYALDEPAIQAVTDYLRRVFPRFRPLGSSLPDSPDIPVQRSLFQDSGISRAETPMRSGITFRSRPILP